MSDRMNVVLIFLLITGCCHPESDRTTSGRLSREESDELKKTCGERHQRIEKRSVGGRKAEESEFPWTVAVLGPTLCSGALISERHVLTSAHCGINRNFDVRCEEGNLESSYEKISLEDIVVVSGMEPGCSVDTKGGCTLFGVTDMTVHPQHNPCTGDYDVALLELKQTMTSEKGLPICMPKEDEEIPTSKNRMTVAGFGYNPEHPDERYLEALNVSMDAIERPRARLVTKDRGKSICKGDSGGPLFKVKKTGKSTLLGITMGYHDCVVDENEHSSFYVDVRQCVTWVCQITGVCPKTRSSNLVG